ncbi:hypothetical protein AKO1_012839 [Acrasis kona]|uniref:UDENN domain-containing protein n=1 Tax=Acrasis kona TaxID=1008807 RepID=A0AAW2YWC3_9EUKA
MEPLTIDVDLSQVSPRINTRDGVDLSIECMFVTKFDTKRGNLLEYSKFRTVEAEKELDLEGIEFRTLPSGIHKLDTDYVHNTLFGIACFHKLITAETIERGARMRSVGVLVKDYRAMVTHFTFCEKQAQSLNENGAELTDTTTLERYMDRQNGDVQKSHAHRLLSDMFVNDVSRSVSSLSSLFHFYGASLLTIWKILLLRKRILFFSDVPIGVVCARVHACGHLLELPLSLTPVEERHGELGRLFQQTPTRYYYISVNDLTLFEKQEYQNDFFIACTADKILTEKTNIYDVLCDRRELIVSPDTSTSPGLRQALQITPSDIRRTNALNKICSEGERGNMLMEMAIHDYFAEMNEAVLNLLKRHTCSKMEIEDFTKDGLFDAHDGFFLQKLSDVLEANVDVELPSAIKSKCCSIC